MVAVLLPAASVMLPFVTALPCNSNEPSNSWVTDDKGIMCNNHRIHSKTDTPQQLELSHIFSINLSQLTESVMPPAGEPLSGVMK